jgi:hypothetical protein
MKTPRAYGKTRAETPFGRAKTHEECGVSCHSILHVDGTRYRSPPRRYSFRRKKRHGAERGFDSFSFYLFKKGVEPDFIKEETQCVQTTGDARFG